jgi:hypothetical protein
MEPTEARIAAAKLPDQQQPATPRRAARWLAGAAAGGLVLLGAGLALAVALPLALRRPPGLYERLDRDRAAGDDTAAAGAARLGGGVERRYFLSADPIDWDYAPGGRNLCKGTPFGEHERLYVAAGPGLKYKKAVFREYTDATFKARRRRRLF